LPLELQDLQEQDFDLRLTGFDDEELSRLLADTVATGIAQEDDVPEAPKDPVTKPGDLWLLGKHRLYCGDSTKAEDLEALMQDDTAVFSFTSPPYLDMRDYDEGFDGSLEVLTQFIPVALSHCDFFAVNLGLSRKDGKINRYWDAYIQAAETAGLPLTAWNIWSKQGMGGSVANMSAMFPIEHEWILVFGGDKDRVRRTKKNKRAGEFTGGSNRQKDGTTKKVKPKIVREFGRMGSVYVGVCAKGGNEHPAAFPVHLPYEYIVACSAEGDAIYEPFGGSGTTMIACEQSKRACRMMELSPKYCDVIIERWQNFTGKEATHAKTRKAFATQRD
jgi:DNA modification methylase